MQARVIPDFINHELKNIASSISQLYAKEKDLLQATKKYGEDTVDYSKYLIIKNFNEDMALILSDVANTHKRDDLQSKLDLTEKIIALINQTFAAHLAEMNRPRNNRQQLTSSISKKAVTIGTWTGAIAALPFTLLGGAALLYKRQDIDKKICEMFNLNVAACTDTVRKMHALKCDLELLKNNLNLVRPQEKKSLAM